jgi:hypothetical protein
MERCGVNYIEQCMLMELERLIRALGHFSGGDEAEAVNKLLQDLATWREINEKYNGDADF